MEFPVLYGKPSTSSKIKQWEIKVIENIDKTCSIVRCHGYVGHKISFSSKMVSQGKNIGKKNETTTLQQAINESTQLWKKYKESGYHENMEHLYEKEHVTILPMLAQDYRKRFRDISSNFAIQPKIDGIRMLATLKDGCICFLSRSGKTVTANLEHIKKELYDSNILSDEDLYIDGEVFTSDLPFEDISGLFRTSKHNDKQKNKLTLLKFHVFDCFYSKTHDNLSFIERYEILKKFPKKMKHIHIVDTCIFRKPDKPVKSIVQTYHDKYVQNGFEGVMVRNLDSLYKINYRSKDLQKYKEFVDKEYKIINGKEASGEDSGTVVFECETEAGERFSVRPRGSRDLRKYMFENIDQYIGKNLTVRYQNLSEKNVPRFPVGITVRDYE
jgi:DNA ligase-1